MNFLIGNVGSTSLKSKLIRYTGSNTPDLLGGANLDKLKNPPSKKVDSLVLWWR